jgi:hypothetical protein
MKCLTNNGYLVKLSVESGQRKVYLILAEFGDVLWSH